MFDQQKSQRSGKRQMLEKDLGNQGPLSLRCP